LINFIPAGETQGFTRINFDSWPFIFTLEPFEEASQQPICALSEMMSVIRAAFVACSLRFRGYYCLRSFASRQLFASATHFPLY